MLLPSSHHITVAPVVSPDGTQNRNKMPTIKPSATAATPTVHPERTQDEKTPSLAPES